MREILVDKVSMTVTAQGGCTARDVEQPCEAEGLSVVFGAVSEIGTFDLLIPGLSLLGLLGLMLVGIGGLTLGGGVGWLTGCHRIALDNLLSARVALANGEVVSVSDTENTDLFWAIRGAGASFGICTEFKSRVHEQGPIFM